MAAVSIESLDAGYGGSHVIYGADLEAREGDITVIVGPNGSGKSTLLRSIFGMCSVYSGRIAYGGSDITGMAPHDVARMGVAYLPQTDNVFAGLTVRENLVMAGYAADPAELGRRLPGILGAFPELGRYMGGGASVLSGGQRQMLAMSMALVRRPGLMLFDEPTAGLSPRLAKEVTAKIRGVRDSFGVTVVLVEQNARRALELGDRAYLVAGGRVVYGGSAKELLADPELGRLYLGLGRG